MYDVILVPVDGSDNADRAVEHALDIAETYGATLYGLFVVDTRQYGEPGLSSIEIVIDEIEDEGHHLLDDIVERAADRDVTMESRVCHGVPYQEILSYAREVDADAIVMGYQGHTHQQPGNIGSVAERVVRDAERPVFTV